MPHTGKAGILVLLASVAFGQGAAPATFELASIKPSDPASTMAIRRSGHRIATTNTSLLFLITWAYNVHSDHVFEKPGWLDKVHYDVVASAPEDRGPAAPVAPGQPTWLQRAMQALLAERFKLSLHKEMRELPMYVLVVGKDGPKFQLTPPPESMGQNPFRVPGPGRLIGTQVSAAMLAYVLGNQLGHTVEDQTRLTGVFDFKLEWQPDPPAGRMDMPAAGLEGAPVGSGGSSIFAAIQEQLGLKLEARKGKIDVLVIDRIENSPTEN
jgi:bla regulator protein blaR1